MKINKKLITLFIFSIAMGLLEAAVVIYIRKLYFSHGFQFPLNTITDSVISITELFRELATIIMLVTIAYIFGRSIYSRVGAFLISFALWDIFYYIFLKIFLGWPESLFTWDVLFLIPVPWVGPVVAPVIVALTMILLGIILIKNDDGRANIKFQLVDWLLFIVSAMIILISFTIDSTQYMLENNTVSGIFQMSFNQLFVLLQNYIPRTFRWWIFIVGELGLLIGVFNYRLRLFRKNYNEC